MNGLTPKSEYISGPLPRMGRLAAARADRGPMKLAPPAIAPARSIWRRLNAAGLDFVAFIMKLPVIGQFANIGQVNNLSGRPFSGHPFGAGLAASGRVP